MRNLVVAKNLDGTLVKGFTRDFMPRQEIFHIVDEHDPGICQTIYMSKLKALFFVRSTQGNRDHVESLDVSKRKMYGKPIQVEFLDGEIITGFTQAYRPKDKAFFMFPADEKSNNERIYVNRDATRTIKFL
ncbi:hypothetical protein JXA40_01645 [bacterium]|nr:hypothetical protein [candidate division CSSED10-310 bacterium]